MERERYGLVLAGGGGKGAYEVGVWRAILELQKIYNFEIVAFSGTSVGALNAAMFACCEMDEISRIWSTIDYKKVLDYQHFVSNGGFSNQGLRKLIEEVQIDKRIKQVESSVYATVCMKDHDTIQQKGIDIFEFLSLIPFSKSEAIFNAIRYTFLKVVETGITKSFELMGADFAYIKLQDSPCVIDVLLASAAHPVMYKAVKDKHTGEEFVDGGVKDNIPIQPIIDRESHLKKIIVVHLDKVMPCCEYGNKNLIHIFPSISLNGKKGTFDFTKETIKKNSQLGYDDGITQLRSYFDNYSILDKYNHIYDGKGYDYGKDVMSELLINNQEITVQ